MIDFSKFELKEPDQILIRKWQDFEVDPKIQYPEIQYLLKINGIGCIPRGDLQAIKAKAKSGKTFALNLMVAGILADDFTEGLNLFEQPSGKCKVLHVDTEQHIRSVANKQRTIYSLLRVEEGKSINNYRVLSLRELCFSDRWKITKEAINEMKPDLVVIDGIVDLTADFNDSAESKAFISELMTIASRENCAMLCVLHENKRAGDTTMRGHLGTELVNKASEVYQVTNNKGFFTVTQTESRNASIPDWAFSIDAEGVPVIADDAPKSQNENKFLARTNIIKTFFSDQENKSISYTKLTDEMAERWGVGLRTTKTVISDLLRGGTLQKDAVGNYNFKFNDDDLFD